MGIFASIRQLLTITPSTDDRYSTVVYPTRGEAVLIHDGLGVANEYPWYHRSLTQPGSGSETVMDNAPLLASQHSSYDRGHLLEEDELRNLYSICGIGNAFGMGTEMFEDDPSCWDRRFEPDDSGINPAGGLPMLGGGFDVAGNPYGSGSFFPSLTGSVRQAPSRTSLASLASRTFRAACQLSTFHQLDF